MNKQRLAGGGSSTKRRTPTNAMKEFRAARSHCNHFETLGHQAWNGSSLDGGKFACRSALKLANMDASLDFILTRGSSTNSNSSTGRAGDTVGGTEDQEEFTFVDLCGAPGGFSEYILHRYRCPSNSNEGKSKSLCLGYGMSLMGTNEHGEGLAWNWKHIRHMNEKGADSNCSLQICEGEDETGDIYNWNNVIFLGNEIEQEWTKRNALRARVLEVEDDGRQKESNDLDKKNGWKVDLVVADGGFDAQRDSNHQEQLSFKIVTCEIAAALYLLKRGGNLVVKMFGYQTIEINKVLQHLYDCFGTITSIKPVTSRPASAERYLVCLGYDGRCDFDVRAWRDKMLGDATTSNASSTTQTKTPTKAPDRNYIELEQFLAACDHDMLHLNIRACHGILSHLEQESTSTSTTRHVAEKSNSAPSMLQRRVDFSNYRKAWNI
jgi:cap1 methyltransferase